MLTNKITLILIIILLLIFFIRQNKSHEQFTSNALVEWNKSATEYLCDNELDDTNTKASFIKFCDRVVSDDDYKKFSYIAVDKPSDYVTKKIHRNNIRYGEKFSSDWDAFPNKTIIGNDIGDYKLNLNSCKKFANTKEDVLGFTIAKRSWS